MPASGVLVVDKPQGVTSHDVVAAARGAVHTRKVGHAGTLDPMATGVLVVGFGDATRLLNIIVDHDKTYEATIRLGQATDTDDADGTPVDPAAVAASLRIDAGAADPTFRDDWMRIVGGRESGGDTPADGIGAGDADVSTALRARIERVIGERLTGRIEQVPNAFSAIKIDGRRAYDLAREGKDVTLAARPVTIGEFAVLGMRLGRTEADAAGGPLLDSASAADAVLIPVIDLDVRVTCSAGTYIRALARDLGAMLGVGGHLTRLRRTRVGRFAVDAPNVVTARAESKTFVNRDGETVTRNRAVIDRGETLAAAILPMDAAVRTAMPVVEIDAAAAVDLRFGRRIAADVHGPTAAIVPAHDGTPADVVAIVERARRGEAKPVAVFAAH
ncbi:tRNA pseudouridine synthase B [Bifidobacterium samirii]|nr:tRNA pseudouridine(55) synthase TruB [Bifidobacterium samirii]